MNTEYDMREVYEAPSWVLHKLATISGDEATKVATVLWGVWYARNLKVWENKVLSPVLAMEGSSKQIMERREALARRTSEQSNSKSDQTRRIQRWAPPVEGVLKLNVDVSVLQGRN